MLLRAFAPYFHFVPQFVDGGFRRNVKFDRGKPFDAGIFSNVEMLGGRGKLRAHVHPWAVLAQECIEVFLAPNDAAREFAQAIQHACLTQRFIDPVFNLSRGGNRVRDRMRTLL
ncbi:hypothetical protein [Paraburkholderia sp. RAU2J]|uniref:hypothetical protein n=1 Tax=Paraburkholderia sp. RAU2J TaxID=1938810 RepID=UPI000EACE2C5|nr:hypothetical protein [Paraburkholderia sp. RAU2J]